KACQGQADVGVRLWFQAQEVEDDHSEPISSARLFSANLHRGFLPFNRGRQPHRWPLIDGSPCGVTLHVLDTGEETGPVICQTRVEVRATDDAATLYRRLDDAADGMLEDRWDHLSAQVPNAKAPGGSSHRREDINNLRADGADRRALNLLRALKDDEGAIVGSGAERVRVRLLIDEVHGEETVE